MTDELPDGWTQEEWDAWHNVECPEPEEITINLTTQCVVRPDTEEDPSNIV